MSESRIEGFLVNGSISLTVSDLGCGVEMEIKDRLSGHQVLMSVDQCRRLRRLLSAAEKRAYWNSHPMMECKDIQ